MRAVVFIAGLIAACDPAMPPTAPSEPGTNGKIAPPVAPPPTAVRDYSATAEDVAMRFLRAVEACDRATALTDVLTYEEMTAMTKREIDRKEIEDETIEFIDGRCREFKEAHATVVSVRVEETKHLEMKDDPEKLKRDIDAKVMRMTLQYDGKTEERGVSLYFFKTDKGWRFSPKH